MAAALTVTKGRERRGLDAWIARATSSLPVPVSPTTSTGELAAPTSSMRARRSRIAGLSPTSSSVPSGKSRRDDGMRSARARDVTACSTMRRSSTELHGLVMYSKAPRFTASTAEAIEPSAVIKITGRSDCT